jgi:hypothetical protein
LLRHALPTSAGDGQWDLVAAKLRDSEADSRRTILDRAPKVSRRVLIVAGVVPSAREASHHAKIIADLGRLKRELCRLRVAD